VRIAAGGRDLYDALARDGRVATQGILFAVDSDVIRPESTPRLKAIGDMLTRHKDLRLSIEGHTDADGEDTHNLDLSKRRAAAVKAFPVATYGGRYGAARDGRLRRDTPGGIEHVTRGQAGTGGWNWSDRDAERLAPGPHVVDRVRAGRALT